MPEMKVTTQANGNPRQVIRDERMARLKRINDDGRPAMVKVYAGSEDMRRLLRHANGTRFRAAMDQPVEWPNDSFTARRLAEGSIRLDGAASGEIAVDPNLSPRMQAAARKPKPAEPTQQTNSETKASRQKPSPPPSSSS